MRVGVLAVQGAFAEMEAYWRGQGADVFEIRQRADLDRGMDLLALPGGESTVARTSTCALLEREDNTYLALGFNGKMVATAQTQAENANGGDWVNTMGTDESTPETLFVETPESGTDPAVSAQSKFNTLWESIVNAA